MQHPGATISVLVKIFQIPSGTIKYHLDVLEKDGKIRHKLLKNRKRYYGIGEGARLSEEQRALLNIIRRRPGITQKEIIERTRHKRHTIRYNLKRLDEMDIIHVHRMGKNNLYYPMSTSEFRYNREHLDLISSYLLKEIDLDKYIDLKKELDKRYNK